MISVAGLAYPLETAHVSSSPYIVNGVPTSDFPVVGLLANGDKLCSATLIGCSTVLTAAHCICARDANTFAACQRAGLPDPSQIVFLSQHAMPAMASAVAVHPNYKFATGGDVAVVTLAQPVTGIVPAAFNRSEKPPLGTAGTIVGYGRTGGDPALFPNVGIKRVATVATAQCPAKQGDLPAIPAANHVCIDLVAPSDAGTCNGDSGGPLFADLGDGSAVAGIASGIEGDTMSCTSPAADFHTDVFRYRGFVADQLGGDSTNACGDLPPVGAAGTVVQAIESNLSAAGEPFRTAFTVPAGTRLLRVIMNGDLATADGINDFDLFVNYNAPASPIDARCADTNSVAFGACEIDAPEAGTWQVTVADIVGVGEFQLTITLLGVPPTPCPGDCNGDGTVGIDELVLGVEAATDGNVAACPAFDANNDGVATVDELVSAVNAALLGCPPA
jgi:hypothetical protein